MPPVRRHRASAPFPKPRRTTNKNIIGPLHTGTLARHGYSNAAKMPVAARHRALASAVREYGWLKVFRKLNAVAVLNRYNNPKLSKLFESDKAFVKRVYGKQRSARKSHALRSARRSRGPASRRRP